MLFDLIFLSLFFTGWVVCGFTPWLVLSVVTRAHAGLINLPLSIFTAIIAGLAVPILVRDDAAGLWLSFGFALLAPCLLLAVQRFATSPVRVEAARSEASKEHK